MFSYHGGPLCLTVAADHEQSSNDPGQLYRQSKEYYAVLEIHGVITHVLLQGLLLLAYWEVGQAVYPAAFLSVGLCARLGQALGIHNQRSTIRMYPDPGRLNPCSLCFFRPFPLNRS